MRESGTHLREVVLRHRLAAMHGKAARSMYCQACGASYQGDRARRVRADVRDRVEPEPPLVSDYSTLFLCRETQSRDTLKVYCGKCVNRHSNDVEIVLRVG